LATDASRQVGPTLVPSVSLYSGKVFELMTLKIARPGISLPSLQAGASGLNLTYGTPTFGQITSALDPRILQLAMIFKF
jgi:hypothetical protein